MSPEEFKGSFVVPEHFQRVHPYSAYLPKPAETGTAVKPPLGLVPRHIRVEDRKHEIVDAMFRYSDAGKAIPHEWISELSELIFPVPVGATRDGR